MWYKRIMKDLLFSLRKKNPPLARTGKGHVTARWSLSRPGNALPARKTPWAPSAGRACGAGGCPRREGLGTRQAWCRAAERGWSPRPLPACKQGLGSPSGATFPLPTRLEPSLRAGKNAASSFKSLGKCSCPRLAAASAYPGFVSW